MFALWRVADLPSLYLAGVAFVVVALSPLAPLAVGIAAVLVVRYVIVLGSYAFR